MIESPVDFVITDFLHDIAGESRSQARLFLLKFEVFGSFENDHRIYLRCPRDIIQAPTSLHKTLVIVEQHAK